jgi:hypothetical protein
LSSTKQDWTPEPWDWHVANDGCPGNITASASGAVVVVACPDVRLVCPNRETWDQQRKDHRRIVACVNALANIPDPAAYIARLMSIRVTIDTPNEVCDGRVTDTIGNLIQQYGQECLAWMVEPTPESEVKR